MYGLDGRVTASAGSAAIPFSSSSARRNESYASQVISVLPIQKGLIPLASSPGIGTMSYLYAAPGMSTAKGLSPGLSGCAPTAAATTAHITPTLNTPPPTLAAPIRSIRFEVPRPAAGIVPRRLCPPAARVYEALHGGSNAHRPLFP